MANNTLSTLANGQNWSDDGQNWLDSNGSGLKERMWKEIQDKTAELHAQHDQVVLGSKLDANPWLERVGWAHHLQRFKWKDIVGWAALPRDDELILQCMCRSIDRVVDIAQEAMVDGHCPLFTRSDINKKEARQNVRFPFQGRMELGTKTKYRQVLHRIVALISRTQSCEIRPAYELTTPQQTAWQEFVGHAEQMAEVGEDHEDEANQEEEQEMGLDDEDASRMPLCPRKTLTTIRDIDRSALELWIQLLKHRLDSNVYESVILSALAAIGVDGHDETWYAPEDYTPKLSAVIKLAPNNGGVAWHRSKGNGSGGTHSAHDSIVHGGR